MNKLLLLALVFSLSSYAQDDFLDEDLSSETVTVPDIIDPVATAQAPVVEKAPEEVAKEVEEFKESDVPVVSTPAVEDPGPISEKNGPEIQISNFEKNSEMPVLSSEVTSTEEFTAMKSHWQALYAFEMFKLQTPFNFTNGKGNKIFTQQDQQLFGGRLGFGRNLYIGGGLNTTSRVEGFYAGAAFGNVKTARPDADQNISTKKVNSQNYGVDICQSIGFIFEAKMKNPFMDQMTYMTIEPFIEAGAGVSNARSKASYDYDTSVYVDHYRHTIDDKIANARVGAGINIAGRSGFFMFLRVSQNRYKILDRKTSGYSQPNGQGATNLDTAAQKNADKNVKLNAITMFTLGGGYSF
jgi:hypothetical protein